MIDCNFSAKLSNPNPRDQQFTVVVDGAGAGCTVDISIDGTKVDRNKIGAKYGMLQAVSFAATGSATFQSSSDDPQAKIEVTVKCETPCGPTTQTIVLGRGTPPQPPPSTISISQVLKTIVIPVTLAGLLVTSTAWILCLLSRLIASLFGRNWDCDGAKQAVDDIYEWLPEWVKHLPNPF